MTDQQEYVAYNGKNNDKHLHVIQDFLSEDEIDIFQSNFLIETVTEVYGYGHVDVPSSLVERLRKVLVLDDEKFKYNDNEGINEGKNVVMCFDKWVADPGWYVTVLCDD